MLSRGDGGWYSKACASSNSLSSSPSVSKISVASDIGRAIVVRGDIIGYVFALKNCFPFMSLGDIGVAACMAAKAVGVGQGHDTLLVVSCSMPMFYVVMRLVVCVADASVRRGMRSIHSRGSFPCARARFPPSIPSHQRL